MPSLLDDIKKRDAVRARPKCPVALILAEMTPEDRKDLEAAIEDRAFTARAISEVLIARGYAIGHSGEAMQRHRRGACVCAR